MTSIAEILKDRPKGTKLYSPICGECELDCLCYGGDVITVVYGGRDSSNYTPSELYDELDRNHVLCFDRYGRYETTGELMLFPSKENRNWSTFNNAKRFKKGDFIHQWDWTCIYYGMDNDGAIQFFAFIPWNWDKNTSTEDYDVHPTEKPKIGLGYINNETRFATEKEKNLLLSAIEYKGYVWDSEKLELRKKEPDFKPFDKVLVRDFDDSKWIPAVYGFKVEIPSPIHIVAGGGKWKQCIPYEGNEHLLGTTENCK